MSEPIVLSFHPDGAVEYTRNSIIADLWGGAGEMVRVTDIQKKEHGADYFIKWLEGPFAGQDHVYDMSLTYGLTGGNINPEAVMLFPSYETAVEHEIAVLNAMRKAGVVFGEQQETARPA